MSDQRVKIWKQLKGATLPYSFNFQPFAIAHGLTIEDVESSTDAASVATVSEGGVTSGNWVGEVSALQEGCADITLTATFTGSEIVRVRKFRVKVTDPDCDEYSSRDYA